ncbi:Yip1 domain-containing protein [Tieghemostelium lacteum]|uniref:Protein YIPF n=1 Tax=Tieghemostelium lacteum TaxID=361077 RepID=A0A151ZI21_TIELA|nr:Yip1 domain-containing protein [Tieghemostelium lacteum]|eukprot:KYQ93520.1 Yip1 domain-containing protein [Tieghemostelium lacteum]
MSGGRQDESNPFYSDLSFTNSPPQQNNNNSNQAQAIFTNTNINYNDFTNSQPNPGVSYQPNLQFQEFSHTAVDINQNVPLVGGSGDNKIGGGNSKVPESDFYSGDNSGNSSNNNQNNAEGVDTKKYSFYQIPYYRGLFNVDTKEVGFRLIRSMLPIKFSFFNLIKENPDLYGPFWVLTTLVFVIAVSANLNEYFSSDHSKWQVDMQKIVYSAIAIYGYSFIVPLILWGVFKWMKLGLRLLDMLCIYGYTLFIYIPASILCVVPLQLVQWIIVGIAALVSGAFLVTNIFTPLKEDFTKRGIIICAVIGALHLGLALLLKLYFFANNTENFDFSIGINPASSSSVHSSQK